MATGIKDFNKFFKEQEILIVVLVCYSVEKVKTYRIMQENQR